MHRILFICPEVLGGVQSYTNNLSLYLKAHHVSHAILSYKPVDGINDIKKDADANRNAYLHYSRHSSLRKIYQNFSEFIREDDIIVCNDALELAAINYLRLNNKVVFMLHGDLVHYDQTLKTYHPIIDVVFCVSNGLREKYHKLYPSLSFEVAHVLIKNFTGQRKIADKNFLKGVFIGRFEYLKGADIFAEVVNGCSEKNIPVQWQAFITQKNNDEKLMSAIKSDVEIIFDAPNKKILSALESTDILIFPSRTEGLGIAVLEAMKHGVVPIARNLPIGIPDMIINEETGYLADDAVSIIGLIKKLCNDHILLNKMSSNAMNFSNKVFDFETMGNRFMENIERILGRSKNMQKTFLIYKERIVEKIFPEIFFRSLKYFHFRIKYRN